MICSRSIPYDDTNDDNKIIMAYQSLSPAGGSGGDGVSWPHVMRLFWYSVWYLRCTPSGTTKSDLVWYRVVSPGAAQVNIMRSKRLTFFRNSNSRQRWLMSRSGLPYLEASKSRYRSGCSRTTGNISNAGSKLVALTTKCRSVTPPWFDPLGNHK